jgi:UDP-N-acetylmuramoyl-L-alanyl-D-glutamate--2,6-diaminopimelate ligase
MVTEDSRRVEAGAVFVAARGEKLDGHDFAPWAVAAGAIAVIGSRTEVRECNGAPYLAISSPRRALGILAHALAGNPTHAMTVVGVTGTNGKTTTCKMVQSILETAGISCAFFGTIGYDIGGTHFAAKHTTPFGEELAELFVRAREAGHSHVAMEVSSHALDQDRVAGVRFRVAAFTNLTQDHLDYHKDMDAYKRAKLLLFEQVADVDQFAVTNLDDPAGAEFRRVSRARCLTYGAKGDCIASDVSIEADRTRFELKSPWGGTMVTMRLLGHHNVSNALCAAAISGGLGVPLGAIAQGLCNLRRVPGRFESVEEGQPYRVIVDYAHTEDGLRNVLKAARGICEGRLVVVFGCGGDRDKGKRPKMGMAAAEWADHSIVTSDNPRTEDPERILLDIEVGLQRAGKRKYEDYLIILDRAEAIRTAIEGAKSGDVVLIAGKGHEDYQILGDKRIHFDDCEVARAALRGS